MHAAVVWWLCAACAADATMRPPRTLPATPARVTATAIDDDIIRLTWAGDPSATGFRVDRTPAPEGPWAVATATNTAKTSMTDGDVSSEQRFCYRVTAVNEIGESTPSGVVCAIPPVAPTSLTSTLARGPQVVLSWLPRSPTATGYEILRATDLELPSRVATTDVTSTYTDRAIVAGKTYYYEVRAISAGGWSGASNISTIFVYGIE
jgi:titin